MSLRFRSLALLVPLALLATTAAFDAQTAGPDSRFAAMRWRNIGPYRGGRVTAVTGVPGKPSVYFFGATGGGVWKTDDGGTTWQPVSDGYFGTGSIGALAVAPSSPDVVYAGTGEACVRSNFAEGDGVYRSSDGGRSWSHVGLVDTRQIGKILVHPTNPDLVYVAALGNVFGKSRERGVFRSADGGKTWKNVLFVNDEAGAVDLAIDPATPSTVYATFWYVRRKPWGIFSGGPGSGIYKSTDGGDTWKPLTSGLPKGVTGRVGVSVSPVNPKRVWAIVEAQDGGIFRSDDSGETWTRTNDEDRLRERAWYYSHIIADTKEVDTVYVLTLQIFKSSNGGKTFDTIRPRHSDNHDLWIAPDDNQRMINSNDGGANVTVNGGRTWTSQDNQATAQFYRVTTDAQFPYRVYGAQQDNTTVSIASQTSGAGIDRPDWHPVGGGESGWIAPHPAKPSVVFAGSYYGLLTRYDHATGDTRNISVWPVTPGGHPAADMKYRFQWNFPILFSPHSADVLYTAGNVLFKSTNEGQTWTPISPDLTRNDKRTQGPVGGPITGDNSSADFYATIFTVAESTKAAGTIWTGSDDGLAYVTTNGGGAWQNVTPKDVQAFSRINSVEASPHDAKTAYLAVTRYQSDDRRPYVYRTRDLGATWQRIDAGIPDGAFVRVVREDPVRRDLLFAGTERGMFVSLDGGASWSSLQLNLPAVPITDLAIRDGDLVASTQGRAFWILDDLSAVRQWPATPPATAVLFEPSAVRRVRQGFGFEGAGAMGQNPPPGALVYFMLPAAQAATLEFLDAKGTSLRKVDLPAASAQTEAAERRPGRPAASAANAGLNRYLWDMRYPDATPPPAGTFLFGASTRGPVAPPGTYTVKLTSGGQTVSQTLKIERDPRLPATDADLQKQFTLLTKVRDSVSSANEAASRVLDIRAQLAPLASGDASIAEGAAALDKKLEGILGNLVQMRIHYSNDVLSHPVQLNNMIASVGSAVASSESQPTDQAVAAYGDLAKDLDAQLLELDRTLEKDLAQLNAKLTAAGKPVVKASTSRR